MTKQEINDWRTAHRQHLIDSDYEWDDHNNCDGWEVYEVDSKFYRLHYLNEELLPIFGPRGWSEDYELQEVLRKERAEIYWETANAIVTPVEDEIEVLSLWMQFEVEEGKRGHS